jgi:hypothetical protein
MRLLGTSQGMSPKTTAATPRGVGVEGAAEILVQGDYGRAEVHSVDVADEVEEEHERQEAPRDGADGHAFEVVGLCFPYASRSLGDGRRSVWTGS